MSKAVKLSIAQQYMPNLAVARGQPLSKRAQGLPISTVVLIIMAVTVAAIFVIYIFMAGGKSFDITQTFWGTGGNLTKNASQQAGQAPPSGPVSKCKNIGESCYTQSDCCDKNAFCRKQYADSQTTCESCADAGNYCTSNSECCSGNGIICGSGISGGTTCCTVGPDCSS